MPQTSGNNDIAVFSQIPVPDVTTGPSTILSPTSAKITGHVDPVGTGSISDCHFEYLAGNVTNEIQNIAFTEGTKEGTFTVTFEGQTTKPVQFAAGNFTAEDFRIQLEKLSTIGAGNVRVSGEEKGPFKIEFKGKFTDLNVPQVTTDFSGLMPSGSEAIPTTRYDGNGWSYSKNAACSPPAPLSAPTDVTAELTNLTTFTRYHYRVIAARSDGEGLARIGKERVFTPAPAVDPMVDATSSSSVTPGSAVLSAQINPNFAPTIYRFQYGTDTSYGSQTPASESIGEDGTDHSVSNEVSELAPGTTYHYRVVAVNLNGVTAGPDQTFTTPDRPTVAASSASGITRNGATLSAAIKPGFRPTAYQFEYGLTATYGNSTPASSSIGADDAIHSVSTALTGLTPGTTYHFRVVASNEIGATEGADQTFTTEAPVVSPHPPTPKCKKGYCQEAREMREEATSFAEPQTWLGMSYE